MTSELEYIENIIKATMRTDDYYVENGLIIGSDVGGIIYTTDISNKINPSFTYYHTASKENITRMLQVISPFIQNGKIIYLNSNLRDDPDFENNITRKVDEGAFNYHIITDTLHPIFITLYPGTFHLAKADHVSLTIKVLSVYDNIAMADFLIHKKKLNIDYHIYFLFMTF